MLADVKLAGQSLSGLRLNVMGDAGAGATPLGCVSGPSKNTVDRFGANGVLGIGGFAHDCGTTCTSNAIAGMYYLCPDAGAGTLCRPATVALAQQVQNPVAALAVNNNGVTIRMDPVQERGSAVARGVLSFGIDTASNNARRGGQLLAVDRYGTLTTSFAGRSQRSVIDTGSNGYFFSTALPTCTRNPPFYCPSEAAAQRASIIGTNGVSATVDFTVDNIDQLYSGQAALPGLAAPGDGLVGGAATIFTWGLPFFFGRTVQVLFEGSTLGGVTGPAIGF